MQSAHATLNQMLVTLFNDILRIEESTLSVPGLSIREVHVIEAVCEASEPRMTVLARQLHVTPGSLSVAVTTLQRKGYLLREQGREDKRVIYIRPTEKALKIQDKHKAFHQEMVEAVMGLISDQELTILLKALDSVDRYFTQKELEHS
ncbi:MAG: MarR family transcriptional regulator [Clostridiales bacterium]|nr:MarR family transcriptional regulator [Clostridiales bacterium]